MSHTAEAYRAHSPDEVGRCVVCGQTETNTDRCAVPLRCPKCTSPEGIKVDGWGFWHCAICGAWREIREGWIH